MYPLGRPCLNYINHFYLISDLKKCIIPSRSDRDIYVEVVLSNAGDFCGTTGRESCAGNFAKAPAGLIDYPERYDQTSVMHYDGFSFAKSPTHLNPTILNRKNNHPVVAQRIRPSVGDIQRICRLYNCNKCGGKVMKCGDGGEYWIDRACDGYKDCDNGQDEKNCNSCQKRV